VARQHLERPIIHIRVQSVRGEGRVEMVCPLTMQPTIGVSLGNVVSLACIVRSEDSATTNAFL